MFALLSTNLKSEIGLADSTIMDLTSMIERVETPNFETKMGVVNQCVCFEHSLTQLREMCDDRLDRVAQVCKKTGCGSKCGLCVPYLKAAIRCKADELEVMSSDEFRSMGIFPGKIARVEGQIDIKKRRALNEPAAVIEIYPAESVLERRSA